jgi:hypothetical protein
MKNILLLTFLLSCQNSNKTDNSLLIQGNWCLVENSELNELNYGEITFFKDSSIVLRSRGDTVYGYLYKIEINELLIIRAQNKDTLKSQILKLTSDSLILTSLIEKKNIQTYYRCK